LDALVVVIIAILVEVVAVGIRVEVVEVEEEVVEETSLIIMVYHCYLSWLVGGWMCNEYIVSLVNAVL
jgi:hypothetical protein